MRERFYSSLSFQQIRRIICLAAMLEGMHRGLLKLHVSSLNTIPFSEVKICQLKCPLK